MNRVLWALAPVITIGPALTCIAPRCMAPLFIICGLAALITDYFANRQKPVPDKTLAAILGGLIGFGALSHFWSIAPDETFTKVMQMAGTFGLVPFLAPLVARLNTDDLRRLGWMLCGGAVLGLAVYLSEGLTGFMLYELTHPGNNDPIDSKQNKAAVLITLWLVMMAPYLFIRSDVKQRGMMAGLIALLGCALWSSNSATAQMLFIGLILFAAVLMVIPARISLRMALAGVVSLTILMPVIAVGIYQHTDWQNTHLLNRSLKSRIEIWNQAASRAFERPILGWGLDSAPVLPNRDDYSVLFAEKMPVHHLHPHNGPIHIWFELGAVGIAFFCALFFSLYRRIGQLATDTARKYAVFGSVGVYLYTLSIWGIWQSWFMASLCFAGLMVYAGTKYIEKTDRAAV